MKPIICFISAIALAIASAPAQAKEKITFATLLDPIYDSFLYPIRTGKVKSDLIDLEITPVSVQQTLQAMATRQYDVVTTSVFSIPDAAARGLDVRMMAVAVRYTKNSHGADLWVKSDSPYQTMKDLKGKTIAAGAFSGANATLLRIAIAKKFGMDVRFDNGDFQWLDMPAGAQAAALATNKVDSSTFLHSFAITALGAKDFRPVLRTIPIIHEQFGVESITAVHVSYPDKLAARPQAFREYARMMKEAREYTLSHIDEVSAAVAAGKMPNSFLKEWLDNIGTSPAAISKGDIESARVNWQSSKELGLIKSFPDPEKAVWEGAIREP